VPFRFAPVLSIIDSSNRCVFSDCSTGAISGVACRGACGGPSGEPLDIVMIMDRTSSLSATELQNAKDGAKAALQIFNPQYQHIALGILGPSISSATCGSNGKGVPSGVPANGTWLPVNLSSDYQNADGSLNTGSAIVQTINCMTNSSVGTNLGEPTQVARQYLQSNGRPGVRQVIVLFTDGAANQPSGNNPCLYAHNQADAAKAQAIEVFTIGYGLEAQFCAEPGSPFNGASATAVLADMATTSDDNYGGCTNAANAALENADGDHFLCEPTSGDLDPVFKHAAAQILSGGSILISLPE
jgi:hypothetical protein